jgi:hypothetical protein
MLAPRDIAALGAAVAAELDRSEGGAMWTFPLVLVPWSALCGGIFAYAGYKPESVPEAVAEPVRWSLYSAGFLAAWGVLAVLLSPVIIRVNEGRWDWRMARTESVRLASSLVPIVALMLAWAGVYRLAMAATGGWAGGWRDVPVGAVIGALTGAAVDVPATLVGVRLRVALGIPNQDAERRP